MPIWLSKWIQGLKQTGRFHPTWILLVVLTTLVVAGIVWIPAELVSKTEPDRPPAARAVPASTPAAPVPEEPAPVENPRAPAHATLASTNGDFTPPDIDDLPDGGDVALPLDVGLDAVQVEQVVLNLIRNATEAISAAGQAGGVITLSGAMLSGPARIEIAVGDNGPGVPEHLAHRMFEPMTTSKAEGLGLGLAISQTIIESHGGQIWLQSGKRGGTEFRFTLPLEPPHNLQ